jgi:hypothetical protein
MRQCVYLTGSKPVCILRENEHKGGILKTGSLLKQVASFTFVILSVTSLIRCGRQVQQEELNQEVKLLLITNQGKLVVVEDVSDWKVGEDYLDLGFMGYPWQGEERLDYRCEGNDLLWVNGELVGAQMRKPESYEEVPSLKVVLSYHARRESYVEFQKAYPDVAVNVMFIGGGDEGNWARQMLEKIEEKHRRRYGIEPEPLFDDSCNIQVMLSAGLSGGEIGDVVDGISTLRWLTLLGKDVKDRDLRNLKQLDRLRRLRLSSVNIKGRGLKHLAELDSLRELELIMMPLSNSSLRHLKNLDRLTTLSFRHVYIGNSALRHLKGIKNLRCLELFVTEVTDAGLRHLRGLDNLRVLRLGSLKMTITDAGMRYISELDGLCVLDIPGSNVTDSGLVYLKELPNLTALDIRGTKITPAGLAILKDFPSLKILQVDDDLVTDEGVEHLCTLSDLSYLELDLHSTNTQFTEEQLERLEQSLSECEIHVVKD